MILVRWLVTWSPLQFTCSFLCLLGFSWLKKKRPKMLSAGFLVMQKAKRKEKMQEKQL
jgi:hypothetical protein